MSQISNPFAGKTPAKTKSLKGLLIAVYSIVGVDFLVMAVAGIWIYRASNVSYSRAYLDMKKVVLSDRKIQNQFGRPLSFGTHWAIAKSGNGYAIETPLIGSHYVGNVQISIVEKGRGLVPGRHIVNTETFLLK